MRYREISRYEPRDFDRADTGSENGPRKTPDLTSIYTRGARPVCFSSLPIQEGVWRTCETAGKSGKQIERCVISSFQIAESIGFKGEFRQWEDLLRIGD
jgi:hypothetical protein